MLEEQYATRKARVDRSKFHYDVSPRRFFARERAGRRFDPRSRIVIPSPERPHAKPVRTQKEWNAVRAQVLVKPRQRARIESSAGGAGRSSGESPDRCHLLHPLLVATRRGLRES